MFTYALNPHAVETHDSQGELTRLVVGGASLSVADAPLRFMLERLRTEATFEDFLTDVCTKFGVATEGQRKPLGGAIKEFVSKGFVVRRSEGVVVTRTPIPMSPGSELNRGMEVAAQVATGTYSTYLKGIRDWGGYRCGETLVGRGGTEYMEYHGLEHLMELEPGFKVLWMAGRGPSRTELVSLAKSPVFSTIEYFDLSNNPGTVDDETLQALEGSLVNLKILCLEGCNGVTDAGLQSLLGLPALEALDIGGTAITDAGLAQLASIASLQHVRGISMIKMNLAAVEALHAARPDLTIDMSWR